MNQPQKARKHVLAPGLRRVRESRFLSQAELSRQSGVHHTSIMRIEAGQTGARFVTIRRLAQALNVEPQELVRREEEGE